MKIIQFKNETKEHAQLRHVAYRWLWYQGYRRFASFVHMPPYGLMDVVGVKKKSICIVDCSEDMQEFLEKAKNLTQLDDKRQALVQRLVGIAIKLEGDLIGSDEFRFNLKTLQELNGQFEKGQLLYWRMVHGLHVADYHYALCPASITARNIDTFLPEPWGYITGNISLKTFDYKTYVTRRATQLLAHTDHDVLTRKLAVAAANEIYYNIPDNIFHSEVIVAEDLLPQENHLTHESLLNP